MSATTPTRAATWRQGRLFAVHWDFHAQLDDQELGSGCDPEQLRSWIKDLALDWVQCDCKGHAGLVSFPTNVGTPAPGLVADMLGIYREVTKEMGLPLVVHFLWHHDKAAGAAHPDWQRRDATGHLLPGEICPTSPYVDEVMIPLMMEIIDRYGVDGFWVDRSFWAAKPCWCDRCCSAYCQATGDARTTPTAAADDRWASWLAWHRERYVSEARKFVDAIHERDPDVAVCINFGFSSMQPGPVDLAVDYLSGDLVGPAVLDWAPTESRVYDSRGLPWDLMPWLWTKSEGTFNTAGWMTKPAAQICQEAAVLLSCGGGVQVYDQPRHDGGLVEAHRPVMAQLARFCHDRRDVVIGTASVPQALILYSEDRYYSRNEPLYGRGSAWDPVDGALRALLAHHVHVDLRNEPDGLTGLDDYPLVVLAEPGPRPWDVVRRLAAYVEAGGRLLVTGADHSTEMWQLIGVRPDGKEPKDRYLPAQWETVAFQEGCVAGSVDGAQILLPSLPTSDPDVTEPVPKPGVTLRHKGAGAVAAILGDVFGVYWRNQTPGMRYVVGQTVEALAPDLRLRADAPSYVHLTLRRTPGGYAVHLLNTSSAQPKSARQVFVEEVAASGRVQVRLRLPKRPQAVRTVPDGDVQWEWADGWLAASIDEVGIHLAIDVTV
jgi:hypothetical protein